MKMKQMSYLLMSMLIMSSQALAGPNDALNLKSDRERVMRQYIYDLERADYRDISTLFTENGTVVSTSRGNVNAKEFFYAFLPNIDSARTEIHQVFSNNHDPNRYAARFHFTYSLKDGETGDGEYMFENLKFKQTNSL
jgi:hypothetical protein